MSQNVNYNEVSAFQPFAILTMDEVEQIESMRENGTATPIVRAIIAGMITCNPVLAHYQKNLLDRATGGVWGPNTYDAEADALLNGGLKSVVKSAPEDEDEDF